MSEPFVSSRFIIRDKPVAYPFYDLCNQDSQGPVFDMNVQMDGYDGSVYIRTDHIIEMARSLGMATVEEVADMRDQIAELSRQVNRVPLAQEELKNGIDELVARFNSGIVSTADAAASLGIDIQVAESDSSKPEETQRETSGPLVF